MSILWRTGWLALTLIVGANPLASAEEAGAVEAAGTPPGPTASFWDAYPVHGFLKSRFRARWTSGASDHDLFETLSVDAGDAKRHRVTAHFLGDLSIDLDGGTGKRGYDPYDSVRDSTGSEVVGLVYSAYLDINRVGPMAILRLGRQSIYETPAISFFDGLRAETKELGPVRLRLGAYGGVPVHLYQGYASGDLLAGAYAQARPWRGARLRLDGQQLEGRNGSVDYQNTLVGVGVWQSLGRQVDLHAHYTRLDDQDRDLLLRASYNHAEWDFRLQASYYQQLDLNQAAAIETDALYPILKASLPYREYRVMASKGFGDHVNVDAGADLRKLTHPEQAADFNHDYNRYYATLDLLGLLGKGSSISLTEEKWDSPESNTESQSLDITCPIGAKGKASVGTAHYLYKYDYYADQEREDVRTYYLKLEHQCTRALRFRVDYTYEEDKSSGHSNELRCEALCTF